METALEVAGVCVLVAALLALFVVLERQPLRRRGYPSRGVTMDSGYPIKPVDRIPSEPATPPSTPSGVNHKPPVRVLVAAYHCPGCRCSGGTDGGS